MEKQKERKVLVGCVTHEQDVTYLPGFLEAIRSQTFNGFDIIFIDTSCSEEFSATLRGTGCIVESLDMCYESKIERITRGRSKVRDYALQKGYDDVCFVDIDVRPDISCLSRLLMHENEIVTGPCLVCVNVDGASRIMPNIFREDEGSAVPVPINEVLEGGYTDIHYAGFGCVRVSSKVLKSVEFRFFKESMAGEDMAFFADAKSVGFSAFADFDARCSHLVFPADDPRNSRFCFDTYVKRSPSLSRNDSTTNT